MTGRDDGPAYAAELMPELATGTTHCWDCHDNLDNHYPCGVPGCACYCQDPDTPERMKQPPAVTQ